MSQRLAAQELKATQRTERELQQQLQQQGGELAAIKQELAPHCADLALLRAADNASHAEMRIGGSSNSSKAHISRVKVPDYNKWTSSDELNVRLLDLQLHLKRIKDEAKQAELQARQWQSRKQDAGMHRSLYL